MRALYSYSLASARQELLEMAYKEFITFDDASNMETLLWYLLMEGKVK